MRAQNIALARVINLVQLITDGILMVTGIRAPLGTLCPNSGHFYVSGDPAYNNIYLFNYQLWVGVPYTVRSFIIYDNDVTLTLT